MPSAPSLLRTDTDSSTRERILQVALESFAALGFDGSSTRAIAARAGVNQGLIPYYFGTKEMLWREAVDSAFGLLSKGVGEVVESLSDLTDRERVAVMIRRYVRFVGAHPEFVRLMHEEGKRDGDRMRWLVDRHVKPVYDVLTGLFTRAGVVGNLPSHIDPLHFHYIFVGAVGALFHQAPECQRLTGCDPTDPAVIEDHADAIVHLFLGDASLGREASGFS